MRSIIINGNNFSTLAEFYDEIEQQLTKNLDWKIGRNLNAFNDVLRGGFGIHEYDEDYKFIWLNSKKSQTDFKEFQIIIEIIGNIENTKLELN